VTKLLPGTYRSQRDNKDLPLASCNTTAVVMALEASGFPPSLIKGLPDGKQPEDFLTEFGDSPGTYEAMKTLCPWFFGPTDKGLPAVKGAENDPNVFPLCRPPEAPLMLPWIVERTYGKKLLKFLGHFDSGICFSLVESGLAAVVDGTFTSEGHYLAVVGYEFVDEVAGAPRAITAWRVRDPWGDWNTKYSDENGDGVSIAADVFKTLASKSMLAVVRPV